ncbi:MAG TPA: hypothetical protein VFX97_01380 [Pyrinomonadaceae bacterium]|nr:hypothetical protein [Pyrinomonadaceae bacterium]
MSDKSGYTKKETDWLGREKEVHYDANGEKAGETKFTEDWRGRSKQEHYDSAGEKKGETRKGSDWLGRERAVHYGSDEERVGYSKNEADWLGNQVQSHYDTSDNKVGDTRREEDWLGNTRKVHSGTHHKSEPRVYSRDSSSKDEYSTVPSKTSAGVHPLSSLVVKMILIVAIGGLVVLGAIKLDKSIKESTPETRQPAVVLSFKRDPKPKLPERVSCGNSQPILLTQPNKWVSINLRKECWTGGVDDPAKYGNGFFETSSNSKAIYMVQCSNEKELAFSGYMQAYQYMGCAPPMYFKAKDKALVVKVRIWKPF